MVNKFKITKELVDDLLDSTIMTPASDTITDFEYIEYKVGSDGFNKVVELFDKFSPIKYSKLIKQKTRLMNMGISELIYFVPMELFGWTEKDIRKMGYNCFRLSFFMKIFIRNILTTKQLIDQAPKLWSQFFTKSSLSLDYNLNKRWVKIFITNMKAHKILMSYLEGYFAAFTEFTLKNKVVKVKHVKTNGVNHEFIAMWD